MGTLTNSDTVRAAERDDLMEAIRKLNAWYLTADRSAHSWADLADIMDELNRALKQ